MKNTLEITTEELRNLATYHSKEGIRLVEESCLELDNKNYSKFKELSKKGREHTMKWMKYDELYYERIVGNVKG